VLTESPTIQAAYDGSAQFSPTLSINGNAIFCTGNTTRPFTMLLIPLQVLRINTPLR
jgi:hypothetical protein